MCNTLFEVIRTGTAEDIKQRLLTIFWEVAILAKWKGDGMKV